jgi:hypothetical protein
MENEAILRQHLVNLLTKAEAHVDFETAIQGIPDHLRGVTPQGADHSAWELLEHIRFAQHDILDFSLNPDYQEQKWPDDYWPKRPAPLNDQEWEESIASYRKDLKALCALVTDNSNDLFAKIPHGDGQTILREAMLTADHTSYHVGQIVLVRRLLGCWK